MTHPLMRAYGVHTKRRQRTILCLLFIFNYYITILPYYIITGSILVDEASIFLPEVFYTIYIIEGTASLRDDHRTS